MTVNSFSKGAVYWAEARKRGIGVLDRHLDPEDIAKLETNRGFAILSVRTISLADYADLLRGTSYCEPTNRQSTMRRGSGKSKAISRWYFESCENGKSVR